jgi:hypothetical protein
VLRSAMNNPTHAIIPLQLDPEINGRPFSR